MNSAESLETRFSRLEQSGRWLKAAFAATTVLVGVLLLLGARQPPQTFAELRTRRLVVVDGEGRERVYLDVSRESQPRPDAARIVFLGPTGTVMATAGEGILDCASAMALRDSAGNDRVVLLSGHGNGHTRIFVNDARPKNRVQVYTQPQALAGVQAMNVKGPWREIAVNFDRPAPQRRK